MSRRLFSLAGLFSLACLAINWMAAIPDRLVSWTLDVLAYVFRPEPFALDRLFGSPALVPAGPPGRSIDPALANLQRHEAGLARLGTVRHR